MHLCLCLLGIVGPTDQDPVMCWYRADVEALQKYTHCMLCFVSTGCGDGFGVSVADSGVDLRSSTTKSGLYYQRTLEMGEQR